MARTESQEACAAAPIFIGGFFRSGTSLLRAMLGQHSRVASGLETHWFELDPVGRRGRGGEPFEETCVRLAGFYGLSEEELCAITGEADSGEAFIERFLGAYAAGLGKPRWLEKTPGNLMHIERIWARWPDARIVHILRDTRDVYVSLRDGGKAGGPADFARRWEAFMQPMLARCEVGRLPGDRFLRIHYEDLVRDPAASMRRVLAFLDEPWEEQVASFSGNDSDYRKVLDATGKSSSTLKQLAKPIHSGRIGVWRRSLNRTELSELEEGLTLPAVKTLYRESLTDDEPA